MTSYEHTTTFQSNLNWGETFKMTVKAPAIADRIFKTWNDANKYIHDRGNSAIAGLNLSVIDDSDRNGVYFIDSIRRSEGYVDDFGNVYHAGEKELVMVQLASGGGGGKFNYSGIQIGTGEQMNVWTGTLEEFNQITPDEHTVYFIDGGGYTKKKNYFYFENTSDAPVSAYINRMGTAPILTPEFSTDTETWVDYGSTGSGVVFTVPAKSKLYMRCKCNGWANANSRYNKFYFTENLNIGGNILSLLYGEDYEDGVKDLPQGTISYTFYNIFNAAAVEDASKLVIDFNTMPEYAFMSTFNSCTSLTAAPSIPAVSNKYSYSSMFYNCTSLVNSPTLPATTVAENSYGSMFARCTALQNVGKIGATSVGKNGCYSMFNNCTSLVNAPALPATTVGDGAYSMMFYNCRALTEAPALPARTVGPNAYSSMFYNCTALVNAPALPAINLDVNSYASMFYGCTSLASAPALPAMDVRIGSYMSMFGRCTSLTEAPALPATAIKNRSYEGMFMGCTSLTKATPILPTVNVPQQAYRYMYSGCVALTDAGEMSGVMYGGGACASMFEGCTSLVNPLIITPTFGGISVGNQGFLTMFKNCTSLERVVNVTFNTIGINGLAYIYQGCTSLVYSGSIKCANAASGAYNNLFNGCSNMRYIIATDLSYNAEAYVEWTTGLPDSGVFVKNTSVDWPRGINGIPEGWIVVNDGQMRGDIMWYKTNDGNIMTPNESKFADVHGNPVSITSNVIDGNGIGVITFSAPVGRITGAAFNRKTNLTEVWLPYTVVDTGQGTFNDCTNLKSIWIWENVEVIGATFNGLTSLQKVYVHATEPPVLSVNQTNNLKNYGASVYVPHESLRLYTEADNWTTIADQIVGM